MARTLLILGLIFMVYCTGFATGFGLCARIVREEEDGDS